MAILATQKVLTLDYWKIASDLKPGDILFDRFGKPTKVKVVQHYRAQNCYRIEFRDGTEIAGDSQLKIPIENEKYRNRASEYKGRFKFRRQPKIKTAEELASIPLEGRPTRLAYSVPTAGPLQFPAQDLPVPPFIFGFWFFNRKSDKTLKIPTEYEEFISQKFLDHGYLKEFRSKKSVNFKTKPSIYSQLAPIPSIIPNNYLLGSFEQRQELLSGIMLSRGRRYNKAKDKFCISSYNKLVIRQIQFLAESLGCKTTLKFNRFYSLYFKSKLIISPEQPPPKPIVRHNWRFICDVYAIIPQGCVHIETENPESGILVGEGFIACN
jgi:hypothetical protein